MLHPDKLARTGGRDQKKRSNRELIKRQGSQRSKDGRPPKRPGYDTSSDGGAVATGLNTSGNVLCESSEDQLGSNHSRA